MSKLAAFAIVIATIFAIWAGTAAASLMGNSISGTPPIAPCVNAPSGMVAWWPLDETTGATAVADVSGGGQNGTPQQAAVGPIGPPPSGPAPGAAPQLVPPAVVGGSLYFYTNQTYVEVPNNASLEPGGGDFSIAGWVYPVQVGPGLIQPIADKFDAATSMGYALYIASPGISNNARLTLAYGDGSLNTTVQSISPIAYSQWHHVAVTMKRTLSPPPGGKYLEVQLYVDGAAQGSQQVGNPVASIGTTLKLLIGGTRISPQQGFGEIGIDEIQIFDRALSPSEIADIHNAGGAGKCTPTPTPTHCGAVGVICTPTPTATICIGGPVPCTPTPTRTATPHSDVPTATPTHCANGTICTPTPTATICVGAAGPCTPTPTVTRTPTPHSDVPTATPTHCGAIGAICTPTPTQTPTRPPDVPTATPTHCGALGAICTPTPTRTPTHVSDVPTATRTRTPTPHKACGDVNDDGRVNSIDANFLLQLVVGRIAHLPNFASADTNHDGSVNSIDATLVLQMDAGLVHTLQCG